MKNAAAAGTVFSGDVPVHRIISTLPLRRTPRQLVTSYCRRKEPDFCEELSTPPSSSRSADDDMARIIQPVSAVEANLSNQSFQQIARRSFLVILGLLAITYAADYCIFQYRVSANRQPFGSVVVDHYTEVAHKDGKSEIFIDPPAPKTCVHAIFPHQGNPPCWYLSRHAEQKTDI